MQNIHTKYVHIENTYIYIYVQNVHMYTKYTYIQSIHKYKIYIYTKYTYIYIRTGNTITQLCVSYLCINICR